MNAMIGGAIFAGILGGGAYGLLRKSNKAEFNRVQGLVQKDIAGESGIDLKPVIMDVVEGKSVGAAFVDGVDIKKIKAEGREAYLLGESIQNAGHLEKVLKKMTPLLSTLQSPLATSRITIQQLINNPLRMVKNKEFIATEQSVERLREQFDADPY
jgi:hypothetical protein